jgi:hypothetical protein
MPIPALANIVKKLTARGSKVTMADVETVWDKAKKDAAGRFKMSGPPTRGEKVPGQYWGFVMYLVKQHYNLNEELSIGSGRYELYQDDYPPTDDAYMPEQPAADLEPANAPPAALPAANEQLTYLQALVNILFTARDQAHMLHLKTTSFAEHVTLNELYDGLLELTDQLAETAQGRFGILTLAPTQPSISTSAVDFVSMLCHELEQARCGIVDTYLNNIIDEIMSLVYRSKYKLENLK